jgi:MFS transporter, DHA1 family, inner membrane transport protein
MDARLIALAIGMFAVGTDSFVVAGILPAVGASLDVGITSAAQLIAVYTLTYALAAPVMAALTVHWPWKRVLLSGMIVFVLGNILTAAPRTFEFILIGRAVAGLGGAIFTPAASAAAAALVPPERRGRALATVFAGLSGATALGAPAGILIGSFSEWRMTIWFVGILGAVAACGLLVVLPQIPKGAPLGLRGRLAPLLDARVAMTLATTLLLAGGLYVVYSYVSIIFDHATDGNSIILAALLSMWGITATIGNIGSGVLTDRFGNRAVINFAIIVVALNFALMPLASAGIPTASLAIAVWGLCGWGFFAPQQHRLIGIAPAHAPVLLALNSSTTYIAASMGTALGAPAVGIAGPHMLPLFGSVLIVGSLVAAELAHWLIANGVAAGGSTGRPGADVPNGPRNGMPISNAAVGDHPSDTGRMVTPADEVR